MWEATKIVGLCVLAAVSFGVVHDQVTARVCLEYFTIGHVDVAGREPTFVALYWGVVATWWVGLPLGVVLAIAARVGEARRATSARELVPHVTILMGSLFVFAMTAGLFGYARAAMGGAPTSWVPQVVPGDARLGFVFDAWAHGASYLGGLVGGLGLSIATFVRRPRMAIARGAEPASRDRLVAVGCLLGVSAPVLVVEALLVGNRVYYGDGRDSFDALGIVGYVVWNTWPWLELAATLAGVVAVAHLAARRTGG